MVVDVTRTRFCDLAGLTVLAQEYKRGVSGGGELRLVLAADSAVSHVIRLTCLDRLIPAFPPGPGPGPDATGLLRSSLHGRRYEI